MVKRATFFALAVILVLGMVTVALAAQNVANTTQKGSLLIWPLVSTQYAEPEQGGGTEPQETYITIGNDFYREVYVKCYWVDLDQNIQDFMFRLTPNQPVWFRASTGEGTVDVPPFEGLRGELKCWAVNAAGDQQISFNHLYGSALVINNDSTDEPTAFQYNAWSFTARDIGIGKKVGTGGQMKLTGISGGYDACPQYLVENFIAYADGPDEYEPVLVLAPCNQDLRQDRTPTCTKARFEVWNENETKYTGAYQCLKCWTEFELGEIGSSGIGFGRDKFSYKGLHTWMARFRVTGIPSSVCKFGVPTGPYPKCPLGNGVTTPFVGVLWHEISFAGKSTFNVGTTPHGAGAAAGLIQYIPGELPQNAPGK